MHWLNVQFGHGVFGTAVQNDSASHPIAGVMNRSGRTVR
ncbi:hypothetical protein L836_3957 [Mycobacteroides abscessus MAB_110811_2726]|nr:hypothetical protein L836_3957 [Mycobacteroides abscessus MAB_110811_2726]